MNSTMAAPSDSFLRTLVTRHSLLYQMVRRDFEQRFVGSAAGWLWSLIHPLVLLLSWTFVFQWCLKVPPPPDALTQNYTLFLFCGYLPWMLFQETVQRSANSLIDNANLITKTIFPSELVPVSIFLSSLVSHLIALCLVIAMVAVVLHTVSVMVLLLPLYTVLLGLFAVGVGWIFAALQVYLRDTAQVVVVLLTGWFWLTPIFIDESRFPENLRFLITANPLAYVVRGYRERILSNRVPDVEELAVLALYAVGAFLLGAVVFKHLKSGFADVL
jgi:ABC-type polysaccharide/polyol phosphate export systems, permease component